MQPQPSPSAPPPAFATRDFMLTRDIACANCGHNLRGLRLSGNCAECGDPVRFAMLGSMLYYQSPAWLSRLHAGAGICALTALLTWSLPGALLFLVGLVLLAAPAARDASATVRGMGMWTWLVYLPGLLGAGLLILALISLATGAAGDPLVVYTRSPLGPLLFMLAAPTLLISQLCVLLIGLMCLAFCLIARPLTKRLNMGWLTRTHRVASGFSLMSTGVSVVGFARCVNGDPAPEVWLFGSGLLAALSGQLVSLAAMLLWRGLDTAWIRSTAHRAPRPRWSGLALGDAPAQASHG